MTGTDRHDDEGRIRNMRPKAALAAIAALVVIGYILVMPVLLSSFDGAPNDMIGAWLDRSTMNVWLLVAVTIIGLGCWIGAAALEKRYRPQGRMAGWRSLIRPVVTVVTGLCGFCVCFSLPMLCLLHLG
ncbi:hypothetical protein [Bifidobacterium choerinum]|uniref:Uncharacterized protein n=1 Tax=Bifidobacterium choerinum TaxID=35760 RepID=A0A087AH23_9BIFI|nr:hypothetical protein [Bifidobacterium choerinum]KFI58073.1 hypothetical protein BCHO_0153 [Bifidobacterium choerinum]